GKGCCGRSTPRAEMAARLVPQAGRGAHVVRLKSGHPGIFGRLDEEIAAVAAAGIGHAVSPGITSAAAAAAGIRASLTRRGRNAEVRLVTGHDTEGSAEQDRSEE